MAGLPGNGAIVSVGPPLSFSGPSNGSAPIRSVGSKPVPLVVPKMLYPPDSTSPERSPSPLSPTMEFVEFSVPRLSIPPPPNVPGDALALTVAFLIVSVLPGSELEIPPPDPSLAEFPLIVLLISVAVP